MREKGRAAVYGMAGCYLLYLAYRMFCGRMDNGGSEYALMVFFSVVFVLLGGGLLGFSAYITAKLTKRFRNGQNASSKEDTKDI